MKNINSIENIIIGGSGFIGSALCDALSERGESVLSIAKSINEELENVKQIGCDISNKDDLKKYLKGGKNIYILVGQVHKDFVIEKEIEGLKNILFSLDKTTTERVFYFSSTLVYGNTEIAADENTAVSPTDEYSRFKLECEDLVLNKLDNKIVPVVLRLSNVYGNVKNKGFIGLVFKNIFEHLSKEILINGGGKQSRDYIFIDDVIRAVLVIKNSGKDRGITNICTGENHDLIWLINKVSSICGKEIKYTVSGDNFDPIKNNMVSNSRLKEKYGFSPKYNLEDGLNLTFEKYKEAYGQD